MDMDAIGDQFHVGIVVDQRGCPTSTRDLADAILKLAPHLVAHNAAFGTYHFAGTGATIDLPATVFTGQDYDNTLSSATTILYTRMRTVTTDLGAKITVTYTDQSGAANVTTATLGSGPPQ